MTGSAGSLSAVQRLVSDPLLGTPGGPSNQLSGLTERTMTKTSNTQ